MDFWSSVDNTYFRLNPKSLAMLRKSCRNREYQKNFANDDLKILLDGKNMNAQQYECDSDLINGLEFFNAGDTASALSCFTASMKRNNPLGALALGNLLEQKFLEICGDNIYYIGSDKKIDSMLNMLIAAYMFGAIFAEDTAERMNVESKMEKIACFCGPEEQLKKICEDTGEKLQNYILQSPELMLKFL